MFDDFRTEPAGSGAVAATSEGRGALSEIWARRLPMAPPVLPLPAAAGCDTGDELDDDDDGTAARCQAEVIERFMATSMTLAVGWLHSKKKVLASGEDEEEA